jgi:hypothetical protein
MGIELETLENELMCEDAADSSCAQDGWDLGGSDVRHGWKNGSRPA